MSIAPVKPNAFNLPSVVHGFSLEEVVPIDRIREHAKIDDVSSVTNGQLELYRQAAFESAEKYTGFYIGKRQLIKEPIKPRNVASSKRFIIHRTEYSIEETYVTAYGLGNTLDGVLSVEKSTHIVRIPMHHMLFDMESCCRPCGNSALQNATIQYYTGFAKISDIPAGVLVGILRYIAWSVANPGDEFLSVNNQFKARGEIVTGTSNVAWASGALEIWRQYNRDAF